jgi:hypothetical protein
MPLIASGTLVLHALLASVFPMIYGGDTILRLCNFERIRIAYQLPLFQALIHFTLRTVYSPVAVWALMALLSAAAATGIYALTHEMTEDRRAARVGAILFATHPFILVYSRVPYQEPLLLAAIAWGFYFLFLSGRTGSSGISAASILCFNAAALTRYEGWIAAAVAAAYHMLCCRSRDEGRGFARTARDIFLYTWPVLLWMLINQGLSPAGTFVLDTDWSVARFYRPFFLVKSAVWWTNPIVTVMVLFGAGLAWKRRGASIAAFVVLLLAALLFSGHGIAPDPERFVTEREAYVPIALMMPFVGAGAILMLAMFLRWMPRPAILRRAVPLSLLIVVSLLGVTRARGRIAALNFDPEARAAWEVSRFLSRQDAGAIILGRPLPEDGVRDYLDRAERAGGPEGRSAARAMLLRVESAGFDYQRVLVWSWMGKSRIISSEHLTGVDPAEVEAFMNQRALPYVVVFSDFAPRQPHEREFLALANRSGRPVAEFGGGGKRAVVYRIR